MAAVAALVLGRTQARPQAAAPAVSDDEGGRLVGEAPAFREALRLMAAAARVDSAVLITGESGTGKEELARALHGRSKRAGRAFVAVNCGAIPEALAESALFGHQKGAFTGATATQEGYFEAADGGTLFLDEVGELAPAVQVKLLRALQERLFFRLGSTSARRADVRVVAATHRDLEQDVAAGRFRQDLFFRLNVLRIPLPPLRERPEDLPALARVLLARIADRLGRRCPVLDATAERALGRWRWPGNARELGNVLERLLVLREPEDQTAVDAAEVNTALGREPADARDAGRQRRRRGRAAGREDRPAGAQGDRGRLAPGARGEEPRRPGAGGQPPHAGQEDRRAGHRSVGRGVKALYGLPEAGRGRRGARRRISLTIRLDRRNEISGPGRALNRGPRRSPCRCPRRPNPPPLPRPLRLHRPAAAPGCCSPVPRSRWWAC